MKKHLIIQAFEKSKTQTKGEAVRVINRLSGVVGDPLNEKEKEEMKPEKHLSLKTDREPTDKVDTGY